MKKTKPPTNPIVTIGIPVIPERECYFDQCLQSVVSQTFPDPYEVIIAQHPGFDYKIKLGNIPEHVTLKLIASGKSLSSKRNDIILLARGTYIINIDDDVVPENYWLENMIRAALENDYDLFWGTAKPIYEKEFPKSLDPFEMLIGGFHYDRKGRLRRKGLIGCNFGFKKGLNHKRGKFFENIGRGANGLQDGEETLFIAECVDPKMGLVSNGVVNHYIQQKRIDFSYIVKNQCSNAKARVLINRIVGDSNSSYLIDRLKDFVKAFSPNNHMFKSILLTYMVLKTTVLANISIVCNRHTLDRFY